MDTAKTLSEHLAGLLRAEHDALADFLVALADFDRRRLWRDLGHASLFYYLHPELRLSTGAAFHRTTAAELLQRFPEVAEPLRDGRLCLSSVVELARVLTPANRNEVLPRLFHRSKREAQAVAVEIRPAAVVVHREMVTAVDRRLSAPAAALAAAPAPARRSPHPDRHRRPAHGRAQAPPRHRLAEVPPEAGCRPRRHVPRGPGGHRRAGAGGRAGPAPAAAGAGEGARREAEEAASALLA